MKLLYVTDSFSGIKPIFFEGAENPKGSPAFYYPLTKIIGNGFEVDFILPIFSKNTKLNIRSKLLSNSKVYPFAYDNRIWARLFSDIKLILFIYKILKSNDYKFVYGHGSFGIYGTIVSQFLGIPCGARLYGTFLHFYLQKFPKLFIALRYYRQYLPFITKKSFLIVTNDGTKGDRVYHKIASKQKYDFHFLLNGVDKDFYTQQTENDENLQNVLVYPARIEKWKNQEFALKMMVELEKLGENIFNLHLAGTIYDEKYWNKLRDMIKNYKLESKLTYVGSLDKNEIRKYYLSCFAVLSFYDFSNLGNVSIETLNIGGLLIARNDGSLDGIVTNNVNAILVNTPLEAAKRLVELHSNRPYYFDIRRNAREQTNKMFHSWEKRGEIELDLIQKAIRGK